MATLKKLVLDNLSTIEAEALATGKRLTQKRGSQNLCVIDAFAVPLESHLAKCFSSRFSFKKKYEGLEPSSVYELIVFLGGIGASIKALQNYQKKVKKSSLSEPDGVLNVIDTIEYLLVLAKGKTAQHGLKIAPSPLPFCALCWRRVEGSLNYCLKHHPSRSSGEHKSAKHKLFKAIERHGATENIKSQLRSYQEFKMRDQLLAKKLYMWTSSFSPNPNRLIHIWKSLENSSLRVKSEAIVEAIQSIYPAATAKLRFPEVGEELDELSDWVLKVLADFDESEAYCWLTKDDDVWLDDATDIEIMMTFANMVSRLEAVLTIDALPVAKNGPDKGFRANRDMRRKIKILMEEQIAERGSVNQAAIARDLGISRQRISKIVNSMK
ncbi:MarR family transcriptional regulator [Vibrio scophthalmi]|uniref:helix-turn-helix domain-containing protein n=1 Tax=Vibrio scophthalmi TaxID=45658 RepID=UPI002FF268FE